MVEMQEVNWNDIEEIIKKLSKRVLELNRTFSSISTVSRGGLIPSRLIADALDIKKSMLIKIIFHLIPCL